MTLLPLRRKSYSGFLRCEKMPRPRQGLNSRTSDPVANMITTWPPVLTPVYLSTKRKRERWGDLKDSGCITSVTKGMTLFTDLMEDDVKFFQYFIHCACVFYFVRFSRRKCGRSLRVMSFTRRNSSMTSSARAARIEKVALPRIRTAFSSSRFVRCGPVNATVLKLMLRILNFVSCGSCSACGADQWTLT